jgi:hypothetical protein
MSFVWITCLFRPSSGTLVRYPPSAGLCWPLLASAGLCWPLLASAGLCWPLLASAGPRWPLLVLLAFAGLCWPSHPLFCGSRDPMFSPVVGAVAVNVYPRTRPSHVTEIRLFSGRDWCTRERCRLMMQNSWNSLPVTPRILRRARDLPRIFQESQTTRPRARAVLL